MIAALDNGDATNNAAVRHRRGTELGLRTTDIDSLKEMQAILLNTDFGF